MRTVTAVLSGCLVASALILAGEWGYALLAGPAIRGGYYVTTFAAALLALFLTGASVVVGAYVAKANGTAREMTAGHLKRGRGTSRTPMQLLDDALDGDPEARRLWAEYEPGMHGRRQLTYTRELRKQLFPEANSESVDGPATADARALLAVEGVAIYPSLWRRISEVDGLDRMLLVAFGQSGYLAALDCLIDGLRDSLAPHVIEARFRRCGALDLVGPDSCSAAN